MDIKKEIEKRRRVPLYSFPVEQTLENCSSNIYSKWPRRKYKEKGQRGKLTRVTGSQSLIFKGDNEGLPLRYSASSPSIVSFFPNFFLMFNPFANDSTCRLQYRKRLGTFHS